MDNKEVKVDYGRELNLRPPEEMTAVGQSRKRKKTWNCYRVRTEGIQSDNRQMEYKARLKTIFSLLLSFPIFSSSSFSTFFTFFLCVSTKVLNVVDWVSFTELR